MVKIDILELQARMARFRGEMDTLSPGWELAAIISKVNQYYFTGTMQDGLLLIPRDTDPVYWIRTSYERALDESVFEDIRQMASYRNAAEATKKTASIHIETEIVPFGMVERLRQYFGFERVEALDDQMSNVRAVKSSFELDLIRKSGSIHQKMLEEIAPTMLIEGMSEVELSTELYSEFIRWGYQGISRFSMFDTEMSFGQLAFGENSLYPTYFNGPGGSRGIDSGVPILGTRDRKLKRGDLVFVDVPSGVAGYHTDKTMTYMFKGQIPKPAMEAHYRCVQIQNDIAGLLKPGAIPSEIYKTVIGGIEPEFFQNFMGFGKKQMKFLGHGIGLHIDERPVIAAGFNSPIREGMVFALEPKKGIAGVGMVGLENTFIVTKNGAECVTGTNPGLIPV